MDNPWQLIRPIYERHATSASVEEFHRQVNLHFHAVESSIYDQIHCEMWESLPAQFDLLAQDALASGTQARNLRLLDIGCGTGLSSDLLLKSALGEFITDVCLLDTSREMLDRALARSAGWGKRAEGKIGLVSDLPAATYDVVVTCSVLHHIPRLDDFLAEIARRQGEGGIFLHLQDPNRDCQADPELRERCEELRRTEEARKPSRAAKLMRRWNPVRLAKRIATGPGTSYIDGVNHSLMDAGVLRSPLSDEQIWTITDIHDAPGHSAGISLTEMRGWMGSYDMVSARSYGFFGKLISNLPESFARRETELRERNAQDGHFLSAAWRKRS